MMHIPLHFEKINYQSNSGLKSRKDCFSLCKAKSIYDKWLSFSNSNNFKLLINSQSY
jgi:hypothetical protein